MTRHGDTVWRVCLVALKQRDDAQDAFQDAFMRYALADGTVILVRPSGTEPKIKVYIITLGSDPKQRDEKIAK